MGIIGFIGIIFLGIFGFVFFGILGWIIKILGYVFEFLLDGCFHSMGCLVVIIFIILLMMIL